MSADEIYKAAVILREWIDTASYKLVMEQIEALKLRYLNQVGLSEYGDVTVSNKIRALTDLTDSLQWFMEEEQRLIVESKDEAAIARNTPSSGRIAPRPAPHVL